MIAPITDITPRVLRLLYLPVDAILTDAVGVVAINRGCVDELGDDIVGERRVTESQGLPVLENVPPVAFVGEATVTALILEIYGELIPWTAGVSMPPAESDRQVFVA